MVLSNSAFNDGNGQTILAMITSARSSSWPTDLPIEHAQSTGLEHRSVVRWKLFTIPNEMILRRVGALADTDRRRAAEATRQYLSPEAA
jgi:mRNA interferase MazF